jgi:MoaA/NifB/PqqE/SkfB family radical SAM enzyme
MNTVCHHVWLGLSISAQKDFAPCCKWQGKTTKSWDEYLTSPEISQAKQLMLAGQWPSECVQCQTQEAHGILSKRQIDQKHIYLRPEAPWEQQPLKYLSISFGNTCNIACRICNSQSSSKWLPEAKQLKPIWPTIDVYPHNHFYRDTEFIQSLNALTKDLDRVEIIGGEPFLSGTDQQLDFLDHLIAHGSDHISLSYITNGTQWPDDKFWNKWQHFKHVDINLSIDGTSDEFEYNRWPAKWDVVQDHIFRMRDRVIGTNMTISITFTVSVFTVASLSNFIKWALQNRLPLPHYNILNYPAYYDARILPADAKQKICQDTALPKSIKSWLVEKDMSEHLTNFVKITKMQDTMRKQDFTQTFPTLYNLIKDHYA